MTRRTGPLLFLVLAVLVGDLAGSTSAGVATAAPRPHVSHGFVITASRLGGLRISVGTSARRVLRSFSEAGQHGSVRAQRGSCYVRIRGLRFAGVLSALFEKTTPANCTLLPGEVEVSGSRWHTANGLRVGDTAAALHRRFPRAAGGGPGTGRGYPQGGIPAHAHEWQLTNMLWRHGNYGAHLELVGYVRHGRVVALGVETFGH
jgi:hypothetical protein